MPDVTARLSSALADRYKIVRRLGEGGMAAAYLAHDLKHDRGVALKIFKAELSVFPEARSPPSRRSTTAKPRDNGAARPS